MLQASNISSAADSILDRIEPGRFVARKPRSVEQPVGGDRQGLGVSPTDALARHGRSEPAAQVEALKAGIFCDADHDAHRLSRNSHHDRLGACRSSACSHQILRGIGENGFERDGPGGDLFHDGGSLRRRPGTDQLIRGKVYGRAVADPVGAASPAATPSPWRADVGRGLRRAHRSSVLRRLRRPGRDPAPPRTRQRDAGLARSPPCSGCRYR